jgi:hypothetical protein
MLLEYATDCHKWGGDDEAYTAMALATKMFDKHENMVHGDRNGMLSHQQTLPRFWEAEMAICARAGEKDKTLACFDKVVHNDFKSGSRSVWTQLAQLQNSNGEMHVARRRGPLSNKCLPPRRTLLSRDTGTRSKAAGPQDTSNVKLDRCSKYKSVYCCGRAFQKKDWKDHKGAQCSN